LHIHTNASPQKLHFVIEAGLNSIASLTELLWQTFNWTSHVLQLRFFFRASILAEMGVIQGLYNTTLKTSLSLHVENKTSIYEFKLLFKLLFN